MALRFLFDECMAVLLPGVAHGRNFEAYHVAHRGLAGKSDEDLAAFAFEEDLVVVTNNASDFASLLDRKDGVHPGLIVYRTQVRPRLQAILFEAVLAHLGDRQDLVNRVIEVDLDDGGRERISQDQAMTEQAWAEVEASVQAVITEYDLPAA